MELFRCAGLILLSFLVFYEKCDVTGSRLHICPGCWIPRFLTAIFSAFILAL